MSFVIIRMSLELPKHILRDTLCEKLFVHTSYSMKSKFILNKKTIMPFVSISIKILLNITDNNNTYALNSHNNRSRDRRGVAFHLSDCIGSTCMFWRDRYTPPT